MLGQGEIHSGSFLVIECSKPYSVFFQIVDSVRTAFSSVVMPSMAASARR
jgi:hypothetical protein